MSLTVHKIKLKIGENFIYLPKFSRFISVGEQSGEILAWFIESLDQPIIREKRCLYVALTGEVLPEGIEWRHFLGTVQVKMLGGELVYHVFDIAPNII